MIRSAKVLLFPASRDHLIRPEFLRADAWPRGRDPAARRSRHEL